MGSADKPISVQSQQLNQSQTVVTGPAQTTATFTFPAPPLGFTWTGTLWCANAPTGAVFIAAIGGQSWGEWGGNSVYGPVQAFGQGAQQLVVQATGLASSTSYTLNWIGSSDDSDLVAAVFPEANSTALTATISGTVGLTPGSTVGITGSVATTSGATTVNGAGFTGASASITALSTASFPSSGLISIPGSGGTLIFAYTGTTATSFTGCSLQAGVSNWTIANGAAITQAASTTGQVVNNPNAPTLDQILTSGGTAFVAGYTAIFNSNLANSYSSFMVIFAGIYTTGQEISVILSNSTTGETWTLSQTNYTSGQVLEFNFPIPVTAGQGLLVQVAASPNITLAWQIIGYRDKNRISLANNVLDTLHVNPYGGTLRFSEQLTTGTNTTLNGPAAAQYLRLHSFAVVNISNVTLTGSVTLQNPLAQDIFANLMFNMTTNNYWGDSKTLDGQIVPNSYVVITNNTNRTVNVTVTYDVVQFPQIN